MNLPRGARAVMIVFLAALIGLVWLSIMRPTLLSYAIGTRTQLLALKWHGHVPDVSWTALSRRMGPKWMQRDEPTFAVPAGRGAPPCEVKWQTPLGEIWGSIEDGQVLDHLIMEELGGHIYDRAPAELRAGDVVIDVGAHLGTFTRYALSRGARHVVAVEPLPALADCLDRTFASEIAAGTVSVARVAAWDRNEELSFGAGPQSTMGHVSPDGQLRVAGRTIDSLTETMGLATVDFIKMDIEGAEPQALAGAADTLRKHHPRMAICIYHGHDDRRLVTAAVMAASPAYRVTYRSNWQAYFYRP